MWAYDLIICNRKKSWFPYTKWALRSAFLHRCHLKPRNCLVNWPIPFLIVIFPRFALSTHLLLGGLKEAIRKREQGWFEPRAFAAVNICYNSACHRQRIRLITSKNVNNALLIHGSGISLVFSDIFNWSLITDISVLLSPVINFVDERVCWFLAKGTKIFDSHESFTLILRYFFYQKGTLYNRVSCMQSAMYVYIKCYFEWWW